MNLIKRAVFLIVILVAFQAFSQTAQNTGPYLKQASISEAGGTVRINANSARPLAQVLDALQRKYGWVVDYEEPQYVSQMDTVEAPGGASQSLPSGGSFSVEFPASAPDEEKTLRLVVDSYNHSKNPGRFELRRGAQNSFYVVGTAAHDQKGGIAQQQVLLDFPVTLTTQERTLADTVNLICQETAAQGHTPVTLGVSPTGLLAHNTAKIGGTKVSARDLLSESLTATHHSLYWRLLFDPSSKGYFLNIHSSR
jgi:hypothetical protein